MIPRKNNIPTKYFPTVLKGVSLHSTYFRVIISDTIVDNKPHIAVVIAKKYGKLATERNLFKRAISAEIVTYLDQLPPKTIVFMMQKGVSYERTTAGRKEAASLLSKDISQIIPQILKKYGKAA